MKIGGYAINYEFIRVTTHSPKQNYSLIMPNDSLAHTKEPEQGLSAFEAFKKALSSSASFLLPASGE